MILYYDDIARCPLSVFIDCLCDKDVTALQTTTEPVDKFILDNAWTHIREQYIDAMGNAEQKTMIKLMREINHDIGTLEQVRLLVQTLSVAYHPWFAKQLNKLLKTDFPFHKWKTCEISREQLDGYLARCLSKCSGIEMTIEIKKAALEALERKMTAKKGVEPDRAYFSKMVNILEEHFSVVIPEKEITVLRFCDRVVRMSEQSKKHYGRRK